MNWLLTADLQLDAENLATASTMRRRMWRICEEEKVSRIFRLGDLKHRYNPVDVVVINWMVDTILESKKRGLEEHLLMGNHDRASLYEDGVDWFPALKEAGAHTISTPCSLTLDGWQVAYLPYRRNLNEWSADAKWLSETITRSEKALLLFHGEVANAFFGRSKEFSKDGLPLRRLRPEKYRYAIGGHFHLPQKLGENVFYVGSPFPTDWGEANQEKRYLILNTETGELKSIRTGMPAWWDSSVSGFKPKEKYRRGERVRIHVPVSLSASTAHELEQAKEKAEKKYRGAAIVAVPEYQEDKDTVPEGMRLQGTTETDQLNEYWLATAPAELRAKGREVLDYLGDKMKEVGSKSLSGGEVEFLRVHARNYLSFRKLDLEFERGVTVVTGSNKDWGKSNGSGKTSLMSALSVAVTGQTPKGQSHDDWVNERKRRGEHAYVRASFRKNQGKTIRISRQREPKTELRLTEDNKPIYTGNIMAQAQAAIERKLGMAKEAFREVVYVEQTQDNVLLTGREKDRKLLLSKLQNLERYELAEKMVGKDVQGQELEMSAIRNNIQSAEAVEKEREKLYQELKKELHSTDKPVKPKPFGPDWEDTKYAAKQKKVRKVIERLEKLHSDNDRELTRIETLAIELTRKKRKVEGLLAECSLCGQEVTEEHQAKELKRIASDWKGLEREQAEVLSQKASVSKELTHCLDKETELEAKEVLHNEALAKQASLRDLYRLKKTRYKERVIKAEEAKASLSEVLALLFKLREEEEKCKEKLVLLTYARSVFSRKGLPAYWAARACPVLNRLAKEYSEKLCEGNISVKFQVAESGELVAQVRNWSGGREITGQSRGEMRMASLITALAVRELGPKTNLLVVDEPSEGLDEWGASRLAEGLLEMGKHQCVLLASHNPYVLGALKGAKNWHVRRKDGISKMVERTL